MSRTLINEMDHAVGYRIEVYRDACCADHPEAKWYEAKIHRARLREANFDEALAIFRSAQEAAPKARYRLVMRSETHKVSERVLAP